MRRLTSPAASVMTEPDFPSASYHNHSRNSLPRKSLGSGPLRTHGYSGYWDSPSGPWTKRLRYVKVRDRTSYQFALASAAVALDLDGDQVRSARIALGGVATVPWRSLEAEQSLHGKPLNEQTAREAAEIAFAQAQPRAHNRFKVNLGKQTLIRTLLETRDMKVASA